MIVIITIIFVVPLGELNDLRILVRWVVVRPFVVVEVLDTDAAVDSGSLVGRRVMGLLVLVRVVGNERRGCWRRVEMLVRFGGGVLLFLLLLSHVVFAFASGVARSEILLDKLEVEEEKVEEEEEEKEEVGGCFIFSIFVVYIRN